MYDLTRYRPFMVAFSVWFMLVCGCVGDPSLLLSTGTGGGEPVAWQRVDYQATSPSRLRSAGLELGSDFTVFVGDESFDFVIEEVYEDDFGVTLDVASDEQTQRIRIAVTESSSYAFVYVLAGDQFLQDADAEPIALIYRNDEGVFITLDLLPDEQYVMPKAAPTTMVGLPVVCPATAIAIAIPVLAIVLIVGGAVFIYQALKYGCGSTYDCTTPFRRWINGCQ